MSADLRRPGMFGALAHRDYRLMWGGMLTHNIGQQMETFGVGWLVVTLAIRDGTPQLAALYLGFVGFARLIPGFIGLYAGVIADRVDRRLLLIATQSIAAVFAVVLAILVFTDTVSIAAIIAVSTLQAIAGAFDQPARQAMMPRLVPERDLVSAVSLQSVANQFPGIVGPLLGGVLIGRVGIGGLCLLNAVSYVAILGALAALPPQPVPAGRRAGAAAAIAEGFDFLIREPILRWAILVNIVTVFGTRAVPQLLPAFVHDVIGGGAIELSWLLSASGAGLLCASLLSARFGNTARRVLLQVGAAVFGGSLLMVFSFQQSVAGAIVFLVALNAFGNITSVIINALIQARTPSELRGRVFSVNLTAFTVMIPLGQAIFGTLGSVIGIDRSFLIGGAITAVVAALVVARVPQVRGVERPAAWAQREAGA